MGWTDFSDQFRKRIIRMKRIGYNLNVILVGLGPELCCLVYWSSTGDLLLLQISSGVIWQSRDLQLSRYTLYVLSDSWSFFIVLNMVY